MRNLLQVAFDLPDVLLGKPPVVAAQLRENIREVTASGGGVDAARRILAREQLEDVFSAVTGGERAASIDEVVIR